MRVVLAVGCVALIATVGSAIAAEQGQSTQDQPGWMSRTSGKIQWDDENDPQLSVETVQPLFQSDDETYTWFWQGRAAYNDDVWTTNIGSGLRYLAPNHNWLLGVNGWYDRSYEYDHERWGLGAELFGPHLTGRFNLYDAFSGTKTISVTATRRVEERAMDGYDFEVEAPLPYMPWARLSTQYYQWDSKFGDDVEGVGLILRMDMTQRLRVDTSYHHDDLDDVVGVSARFSLGAYEGVDFTAADNFFTQKTFVARDLSKHTLDRVERHNDIVVEQRTVTTAGRSGGVVVRRRD